jgi:hypothetical protein
MRVVKYIAISVIFILFLAIVNGLSFDDVLAGPLGPAPPTLGTASQFAVLAGSTATSTGSTVVDGDLGVSPGASITGFPPGIVNGTQYSGGAVPALAQTDLTTAYNDLAGRPCDVDYSGTDLGGLTLTPGVYCFTSSAQLTGDLTLDAENDPLAVFIFQTGETLTTASNSSVSVINGGSDCYVYWQVGSSATLGTGTEFVGNILALTSITANTNANVSGRLLARNAAVTMDDNNIVRCEDPTSISLINLGNNSSGIKSTGPRLLLLFSFLGILTALVLRNRLFPISGHAMSTSDGD